MMVFAAFACTAASIMLLFVVLDARRDIRLALRPSDYRFAKRKAALTQFVLAYLAAGSIVLWLEAIGWI